MAKEIICLGCPNGCHLECTKKRGGEVEVEGAQCERGIDYGREEMLEPKRVVTAVVRTNSDAVPFVPIKTDKPLLRPLIPELLKTIYSRPVALPVHMGDTLIENFEDTGVNVVFTRSAPGV
jgi:CxxC motif-containing protein